jgi:polygalacturonase
LQCAKEVKFSDGTYLTQNVTVRYNTFRIGMGISVGSESSGGIKDVFIHDNVREIDPNSNSKTPTLTLTID